MPEDEQNPSASRAEVGRFLADVHSAARRRDVWILGNRAENQQFLLDRGWKRDDILLFLQQLQVANYCRGPEPDRVRNGRVWVFGMVVETFDLYIKISEVKPSRPGFVCISFHPEDPDMPKLTFPYRG